MDKEETARRMYRALSSRDVPQLLEVLAADFRGNMSQGLPLELGGVYQGAQVMLQQMWGKVAQHLDIRPEPHEYLDLPDDRLLVTGRYRGTAHNTGLELDAAFAHILHIADERVTEMVQITDTARWHHALANCQ